MPWSNHFPIVTYRDECVIDAKACGAECVKCEPGKLRERDSFSSVPRPAVQSSLSSKAVIALQARGGCSTPTPLGIQPRFGSPSALSSPRYADASNTSKHLSSCVPARSMWTCPAAHPVTAISTLRLCRRRRAGFLPSRASASCRFSGRVLPAQVSRPSPSRLTPLSLLQPAACHLALAALPAFSACSQPRHGPPHAPTSCH